MSARSYRALIAAALLTVTGAAASVWRAGADTLTAPVPADVRAVMAKPTYKNATWALRVTSGSKVLVDYHGDRKLLIGSVRKIFSVGALLDTVGPRHTYDTPIYRTGTVTRGTLHGNLVIVGSGDLTMGGRTNPDGTIAFTAWDHNEANSLGNAILTKPNPLAGYARLARAVRAAGITRVAGDVVIDDRLFKPYRFRDQFSIRPIFVNDDVVDVSVRPGGTPGALTSVSARPASSALTVVNRLRNAAASASEKLAVTPELPSCIASPGCSAMVSGSMPIRFVPPLTGASTVVQTVRIVQPSNYARTVFIEALRSVGVSVDAAPVKANPATALPARNAYRPSQRVALLTGMPYGQEAKFVLKVSYNIGADTSLLLLGVAHGVDSMPAALVAERTWLKQRYGIPSDAYHFVDGSGGGDSTATGTAVIDMLDALAKRPAAGTFMGALPRLGVDGSLASVKAFQSDSTLRGATGNVRAKTGTFVAGDAKGIVLKGQALAGYITTRRGHRLTFELAVNDVPIAGIPDVIKVFQDQGTIAAMLWRDY